MARLHRYDRPGIVTVYAAFEQNNTAYMVMEYLQGRTLSELSEVNDGALSEREAVRYVTAVGQALKEVHEAGVLHLDVKPENVLVTDEGRTVVVDFGAARTFTAGVTESIEVVLTPGYAPLEQYAGSARPSISADVYAVGATLYRLLTGEVPVDAPGRYSGIALKAPDQVNAQVSGKMSKAVMKAMAMDAPDRYQSMDELLEALAKREPPRPSPPAAPEKPMLTRSDGSCRATWANVGGATGYDLRWRQDGAWTDVPTVVSPRTIAPVVDSVFLEVQVRARNGKVPSKWSPIARCPGTPPSSPPQIWKRIVLGVVLLAVVAAIAVEVTIGVTGREDQGSTDFREEADSSNSNSKASREDQGGTSLRGDDGLAPGDNGGTASVDDSDSAPSPKEDGGLTSPAEPEPRVTDLIFPHIESLQRSAPSAYRTNADSVTWRIIFTEAMSNVDKEDYTITGISPWSLTVTKVNDSGSVYYITLNSHALADHNGTIALALSPGRTIEDLAGNDLVNRSLSGDVEFVIDNTGPTVTIDGVPATDSGSFMATFTFSEEVTGFTASDVRVTNATASALTEVHAGREWHVRITPTGNHGDGEAIPFGIEDHYYSVSLLADRVTDLAGNGNTASTTRSGSYGSDVTAPRLLSIVRKTPSTSPAQAASVTWRVTFTEDVQHFGINSVNLLEHPSAEVLRPDAQYPVRPVGGSEAVYDVTFDGLADHTGRVKLNFRVRSDDNPYSLYIQDKAARALLCCETIGADERTFDVDNVAPRVADIVRSSPGREHTNQDEVAWTVTFSEPVRNLSAGDFTVSGTDATLTVTQEGSGSRTWNIIASGGDLARLNTTIRLSFAGTRDIKDAAGNLLAAIAPTGADENTFVIDSVAPALTSIVRQPPKGSPADAETATWRLTFSEHMRGIDATDFAVHGAKIAVVAAGSKADYDLSVSGEDVIPVRAPISVYINRESDITDLAGNALRVPRPPTTIVLPSSAATPR